MTPGSERVVVDSSALLEMLGPTPDKRLSRRLRTTVSIAPEIIDLEVLNVLRREVRWKPAMTEHTSELVRMLPDVPVTRVTHRASIDRIWELRHSITAYDAAYVALAEQLDLPLVTCDAKLAGSNAHKAVIEVYPRA